MASGSAEPLGYCVPTAQTFEPEMPCFSYFTPGLAPDTLLASSDACDTAILHCQLRARGAFAMPTTQFNQRNKAEQTDQGGYLIGIDLSEAGDFRPKPASRGRRAPQRQERQSRQAQRAQHAQQRVHSAYRLRTGKRRAVGVLRSSRRRIGWRGWLRRIMLTLLLGVCLTALIGVPTWALTSPTWRVRHIIIQGTSDPVVIAQIRRLPLTGCNIFRCDLARDARVIAASPLIAQASVAPQYPAALVVSVHLRQVALLWRVGALTLAFGADGVAMGVVNADGRLALDPAMEVGSLPAVLVSGVSETQAQQITKIDENVIVMAAQLRLPEIAGLLDLALDAISLSYQWVSDRGFVVTTPDGLSILFGGPEAAALATTQANDANGSAAPTGDPPTADAIAQGVRLQLAELRALLAWLARTGQRATLIDLRWGAYPYYRVAG